MLPTYDNCTRLVRIKNKLKSVVFTNKVGKNSRYFVGVFNRTIISLALVGYEISIANSHPTRTRGIIVEYIAKHYKNHFPEREWDLTICLALAI